MLVIWLGSGWGNLVDLIKQTVWHQWAPHYCLTAVWAEALDSVSGDVHFQAFC